jgi:hypothetical protein
MHFVFTISDRCIKYILVFVHIGDKVQDHIVHIILYLVTDVDNTRRYNTTQISSTVCCHIYMFLSVVFHGVKRDTMNDERSTSNQRNRPLRCDQCLSIESDIILNNVYMCNKNTHVTDIKKLILIFAVKYNFLAIRNIRESWLSPSYDKSLWVQHVFLFGQVRTLQWTNKYIVNI